MTATLAVVIPALNEAERLPRLLDGLAHQTRPSDQVIVADAGSTDGTREAADAGGALVVDGGKPAAGRNAGAAAAATDLVLFLDADVELDDDFLETVLGEADRRAVVVATAHVSPLERDVEYLFACEVVNLYLDVMQCVAPHAPGFCILVRREVHERIGGFDETVVLAEDHDYVRRAARLGKFRVLKDTAVRTSMRRIEKEGLVVLAFKYLYSELYVVAGRPIHKVPFEYEFAAFGEAEEAGGPFSVERLRALLGDAAEAAFALPGQAFETLREIGDREVTTPQQMRDVLHRLPASDVARLRHYVHARMRLTRMHRNAVLRRVRRVGDLVWHELADRAG
jgi:glycosyltransferase involved in cell wall biosynthesis